MRRPVLLALVGVVVTAVVVAVAVLALGRDGEDTPARPRATASASFTTTPLASYDATGVGVHRAAFCDRVDPRQVDAALGGTAASQRSWSDGDRTRLGDGPTDVSHEFGCEYVGADGTAARAWVFAPPVRAGTARKLVTRTDGVGTCSSSTSTFGSPSSLLTCQSSEQRSATYRGLFGDAWLSCELTAPLATPAADLADRAGRWCVGVARAASASS